MDRKLLDYINPEMCLIRQIPHPAESHLQVLVKEYPYDIGIIEDPNGHTLPNGIKVLYTREGNLDITLQGTGYVFVRKDNIFATEENE